MEGELIEYVRAYPMLYDFKNKYYRNQVVRKEAWDEIGEKLGKSGEYKHFKNVMMIKIFFL